MKNYSIKMIMKNFIIENFQLNKSNKEFLDTDSFLNKGIIDSTGILELLEFIENKFDIIIENEEVIPQNLDSLNNIEKFILSKIKTKEKL